MAKKTSTPTDDDILAGLIAQKKAAGLPEADAIEVAQRQLEHDKGTAEREAAEASLLAEQLTLRAAAAKVLADKAAQDAADANAAINPPAE